MIDRFHSRRVAPWLLLLVAAAGIALATQDVAVQALRNEAQALFEEKQTGASVQVFREVSAADTATADDWNNLALAVYELGGDESTDADILTALERAAALRSEHPSTPYLLGLVHARRGRLEEAAAAFGRAAELDPTDPATLYNLAASLHDLGRVDEALEIYGRVADMGFDTGQQFFVSSLYRSGRALAIRDGIDAARPLIEEYQQYQRRLSQAQRAPQALEAGNYKKVVVPRVNAAAAEPARAAAIRLMVTDAVNLPSDQPTLVDFGAGAQVLVHDAAVEGDAGAVRMLAGELGLAVQADAGALAVADYDNDNRADVLVAGDATLLLRGVPEAEGRFARVETDGLPSLAGTLQAEWVDADHDGDLDIVTAGSEGVRWIANHGGGAFAELTETSGLGGGEAIQVLPADFDDDADIDLFVVSADGSTRLYSNAREQRFEEIGNAVGAMADGAVRSARAGDLDNDGWFDLALATDDAIVLLANKGDGTFRPAGSIPTPGGVALLGDLNNDGWLDVVAADGASWIAAGDFDYLAGPVAGIEPLELGDRDADGSLDIFGRSDAGWLWAEQASPVGGWLRVALDGVKSNGHGIGSSVEVKAGGLYQRRLLTGRWLHVGLGDATTADVVRIVWPNGIIQNETAVAGNEPLGPVGEVERLEGSCPLLYTWDGREWRFINEVLGVAPLGMPLAADVIHPADFDEYVPIPGEAMVPVDGYYEVRLTEELREAGYLDAIRLLAVDHPRGTSVFPNERFIPPPYPDFGLYTVSDPRAVTARDDSGQDWSDALRAVDGDWARPFEPDLYEGLATPHGLELSLAGGDATTRLFLTGWVYWATGSINLQVDEDPRVEFAPVALQVPDGAGGWRTVIDDIGLPNAKNSTLIVDVGKYLVPGDARVRVATTMRLYWDAAVYTVGGGSTLHRPTGDWQADWGVPHGGRLAMAGDPGIAPGVHVLAPESAEIRWRGFSALRRDEDGFETFDYATTSETTNWNQHPGSYTRYGPVDELVAQADDRLVVIGTGDEVAVRFAADLPPVPEGWERDWLLYLNGWVKDGDPNTLGGQRVEPLPSHAMELYPRDAGLPDDWAARYNTRSARRVNSSLRPR